MAGVNPYERRWTREDYFNKYKDFPEDEKINFINNEVKIRGHLSLTTRLDTFFVNILCEKIRSRKTINRPRAFIVRHMERTDSTSYIIVNNLKHDVPNYHKIIHKTMKTMLFNTQMDPKSKSLLSCIVRTIAFNNPFDKRKVWILLRKIKINGRKQWVIEFTEKKIIHTKEPEEEKDEEDEHVDIEGLYERLVSESDSLEDFIRRFNEHNLGNEILGEYVQRYISR